MASGNPENPGFGHGLTSQSQLGSGRVIRQSLRLGETRRLVPVSPTKIDSTVIYGFRKSGKSWIWPWANFPVAARFRACDTSIASSRRDKTIGTGLADKDRFYRDLWLPEIRKILDDQGRRHAAKPLGGPMESKSLKQSNHCSVFFLKGQMLISRQRANFVPIFPQR
ncbi:hypothetical protein DdX_10604 [Ditylenchus destructor]|uniref:Uncharacterized protein n=1 Tax=Ditylenchus destructor TaxID=166010 RepID=A0AAD4MYD1_9BILA|nr:hypothetical protein DdX_10604 [Ditylenchus destructor]